MGALAAPHVADSNSDARARRPQVLLGIGEDSGAPPHKDDGGAMLGWGGGTNKEDDDRSRGEPSEHCWMIASPATPPRTESEGNRKADPRATPGDESDLASKSVRPKRRLLSFEGCRHRRPLPVGATAWKENANSVIEHLHDADFSIEVLEAMGLGVSHNLPFSHCLQQEKALPEAGEEEEVQWAGKAAAGRSPRLAKRKN